MTGSLNYSVQPYQQAVSVVDPAYGLVCSLPPRIYPYQITQINITGPKGNVGVYVGVISVNGLIDSTVIGDSNTAGYANPITVPPGQYVYVVWLGVTEGTATAAFTCQNIGG